MEFFIREMHISDFGVLLVYNQMSILVHLLKVWNDFGEGAKHCHLRPRRRSVWSLRVLSGDSGFHSQQGANGVQVNWLLQTGLGVSMVVCLSPLTS